MTPVREARTYTRVRRAVVFGEGVEVVKREQVIDRFRVIVRLLDQLRVIHLVPNVAT